MSQTPKGSKAQLPASLRRAICHIIKKINLPSLQLSHPLLPLGAAPGNRVESAPEAQPDGGPFAGQGKQTASPGRAPQGAAPLASLRKGSKEAVAARSLLCTFTPSFFATFLQPPGNLPFSPLPLQAAPQLPQGKQLLQARRGSPSCGPGQWGEASCVHPGQCSALKSLWALPRQPHGSLWFGLEDPGVSQPCRQRVKMATRLANAG